MSTLEIKKALLDVLAMIPDYDTLDSQEPGPKKAFELGVWGSINRALDSVQDCIDGDHAIRYWPSGEKVIA